MFVTVECSAVFWHSEISISQPAPFQLHLKAPTSVSLAVLPFVSLRVEFSNHYIPVVIRHQPSPKLAEPQSLQVVDMGTIPFDSQNTVHEVFADLRWTRGGTLVLTATLTSESPTTFSVSIHMFLGYVVFITRIPCVNRCPRWSWTLLKAIGLSRWHLIFVCRGILGPFKVTGSVIVILSTFCRYRGMIHLTQRTPG